MATKTFTTGPTTVSFADAVGKMRGYFDKLVNSTPLHRGDLTGIPRQGIYVFFEDDNAFYVGRTDNLRRRIQEHGRQSSSHNSASFAYHLAKEAMSKLNGDTSKTRAALCDEDDFKKCYSESKTRVAKMQVKCVWITDPYEGYCSKFTQPLS